MSGLKLRALCALIKRAEVLLTSGIIGTPCVLSFISTLCYYLCHLPWQASNNVYTQLAKLLTNFRGDFSPNCKKNFNLNRAEFVKQPFCKKRHILVTAGLVSQSFRGLRTWNLPECLTSGFRFKQRVCNVTIINLCI